MRLHLAPLVAAGLSLTAMAATLDKLRIEPPYARTCNTRRWYTSTVREALKRLGLLEQPRRAA